MLTLRILVNIWPPEATSSLQMARTCPPFINIQNWWLRLDRWSESYQFWAHGVRFVLIEVLGGARFSVLKHRVGLLERKLRLIIVFDIYLLFFGWFLESIFCITGRYLQVLIEKTQIIEFHFDVCSLILLTKSGLLNSFQSWNIFPTGLIKIGHLVELCGSTIRIRHSHVSNTFSYSLRHVFLVHKLNTCPFWRSHRHVCCLQKLFLKNFRFLRWFWFYLSLFLFLNLRLILILQVHGRFALQVFRSWRLIFLRWWSFLLWRFFPSFFGGFACGLLQPWRFEFLIVIVPYFIVAIIRTFTAHLTFILPRLGQFRFIAW